MIIAGVDVQGELLPSSRRDRHRGQGSV